MREQRIEASHPYSFFPSLKSSKGRTKTYHFISFETKNQRFAQRPRYFPATIAVHCRGGVPHQEVGKPKVSSLLKHIARILRKRHEVMNFFRPHTKNNVRERFLTRKCLVIHKRKISQCSAPTGSSPQRTRPRGLGGRRC